MTIQTLPPNWIPLLFPQRTNRQVRRLTCLVALSWSIRILSLVWKVMWPLIASCPYSRLVHWTTSLRHAPYLEIDHFLDAKAVSFLTLLLDLFGTEIPKHLQRVTPSIYELSSLQSLHSLPIDDYLTVITSLVVEEYHSILIMTRADICQHDGNTLYVRLEGPSLLASLSSARV